MKTKLRRGIVPTVIFFLIAVLICSVGITSELAHAESASYYVCFSTQNYAVRNANLMTEAEGEYYLYNVALTSSADFYVTNGAGLRWYASDDKPMSVEETAELKYDIKFSPDNIYSEETEFAKTDCNFTYRFNVPAEYSVNVDGEETALTFNPYHTAYDLYYASAVFIRAGARVAYGEEIKTVAADGLYRILFTPEKTVGGNVYKFDENGNYGSGDGYEYSIYIEDAPEFYAAFKDEMKIGDADTEINGASAYRLSRYEKNVLAKEYRSAKFFIPERDVDVKYFIYERTPNGSFTLLDDDNDENTAFGKRTATDVGWYSLSFTDGANYSAVLSNEETPFGGWYAAGDFNGFCFDENGLPDPDDGYRFQEIEEGDDDYREDYVQYRLYLTVNENSLKSGNAEFYITDGKSKYKNGGDYIALNTAGRYKIIFSDEHVYGRLRNYKYVLESEDGEYRELTVSTADEFIDFAKKCSESADYSVNLKVYLKADLDFANVKFVPVGSFSGTFYGGYHTLKNITIKNGGDGAAVFTVLNRSAAVERLFLDNMIIESGESDYVGFVGRNYGVVKFVEASGSVSGKSYVGGIVAYNGKSAVDDSSLTTNSDRTAVKAQIEDCVSNVKVVGRVHIGGVVGYNSGEVASCVSFADVTAKRTSSSATVFNVGGIAGYSSGRIVDSVSNSAVTGGSDSLYVGGIAGLCTGEIYFSENKGAVSAARYAGGIAGYYGTVGGSDDRNDFFGGMSLDALIDAYFPSDGEDFEQSDGDANIINYCINNGTATALSYAGGIVGCATVNGLKIYNCASLNDVNATAGSYAGGIVARSDNADIKGCISSGVIQSKGLNGGKYVGGIVGYGGSVFYSMSSATLKGSDYVGGIIGYGIDKAVANYANVLLSVDVNSANKGSVLGFTEAYNKSTDSFGGDVKANYFVGSSGGIGGKDYAKEYGYAGAKIESDNLSSNGALSPYLCEEFDREYWQGGDNTVSYPTAKRFEEVDECAEYGDESKWQALFDKHAEELKTIAQNAARLTYNVTVMEWSKGDLYNDDNEINYENFEIVAVLRAYENETVDIPDLVHAEKRNGQYVRVGDDAEYFADVPISVVADGNISVYVQYTEAVTSITDAENIIFVEGFFRKGTEAKLIQTGNLYSVELTLGDEDVPYENATVKFFVGDKSDKAAVYLVNGATETRVQSAQSGSYVRFEFSQGEYFRIEYLEKKAVPFWAWLLIGVAIAVGAVGAAVLVIGLVRKSKHGKTTAEPLTAAVSQEAVLTEGGSSEDGKKVEETTESD